MPKPRPARILVVPASSGPEVTQFVERLGSELPDAELKLFSKRAVAEMLLPGESLTKGRRVLIEWADLLVPVIGDAEAVLDGDPFSGLAELSDRVPFEGSVVPVVLGAGEPRYFSDTLFGDLLPADLRTEAGWARFLVAIRSLIGSSYLGIDQGRPKAAAVAEAALRITRIELRNIGCFKKLDLKGLCNWTTVLGDNAAGKSTLLRAIALGLCVETDATVLLKDLQGPLRRDGAKKGTIRIELRDPVGGVDLLIETVIAAGPAGEEFVRKNPKPDPFPWERIFVCGYGTGRSRQAVAPSRDTYSALEALKLLFDDRVDLRNPEVVLLRQENGLRRRLEDRLMRILMLDDRPSSGLFYGSTGVLVRGPWGDRPFRVLSDGYRSTAQWVLDFCAWGIYSGRLDESSEMGGILLIDEVEQHLHPLWQRHFVQRLRQQFPETQVFTTTHTPLLASGVADLDDARLVRLKLGEDGSVEALDIDPKSLDGMRADQVLTSEAFGLATSRNLGSESKVDRFAALFGQETRTPEEEAEMASLEADLEDELREGETEAERLVERAVGQALKGLATQVKPEILELEAKKQLHELFSGEDR